MDFRIIMSFESLLIFSITVFIVSIAPGPSMLLAFTHGMSFGSIRTLSSALGNLTVTLIQSFVSIIGLGTMLVASEIAFEIIKWCGGAFLFYMGMKLILSSSSTQLNKSNKLENKEVSLFSMFVQSAFVTASNPKAIIFFSAVFPQFINPEIDYIYQSIILIVVCAIIAFLCFMLYAVAGNKLIFILSKNKVSKYFYRTVGGVFIGLSLALVFSHI